MDVKGTRSRRSREGECVWMAGEEKRGEEEERGKRGKEIERELLGRSFRAKSTRRLIPSSTGAISRYVHYGISDPTYSPFLPLLLLFFFPVTVGTDRDYSLPSFPWPLLASHSPSPRVHLKYHLEMAFAVEHIVMRIWTSPIFLFPLSPT
jgi:hypothetical protein